MNTGAKIGLGFTVGSLIIVVIGASAYVSMQRLLEANSQVIHTHKIIEDLEQVLSVLKDAETGQRGFILTGKDQYLEPYNGAIGRLDHNIDALASLTSDNAAQQESLKQVRKLADAKLAELRDTIEIRRRSGFEAALPVIISDQGKKIMDDLRETIADMQNREQQLLEKRNDEAKTDANRTIWTISAWISLGMVLFTIATLVFMRTARFGGPVALPGMPEKKWGRIAIRYGSTVAIVAVAVVLRMRLMDAFGPLPLFVTLYPAVLLAASIGGGGPGILATVLSALAADYFFITPHGSFGIAAPNDVLALGIFTGTNLCLCILAERLRRRDGPWRSVSHKSSSWKKCRVSTRNFRSSRKSCRNSRKSSPNRTKNCKHSPRRFRRSTRS